MIENYFNGKFHSIKEGREHSTFSPVDLTHKLWETHFDDSIVDEVINSARTGFHAMRKLTTEKRCQLLMNYKENVLKRKEEIANALSIEVGKPYWEALTEAGALAAKVGVTINESLARIKTKTLENVIPGLNGHTVFKPIGPSIVIGPFNFPCHLANGQMLSLLVSGNSVIFKPSEKTLLSTKIMMECFHEAGFPEGAINFIVGDGKIAQKIIVHKDIKGIYFTGSKGVGLKILESTYKDLGKMVALELGGKNTTIVHKDANLEHTIAEIINSSYLTSGQRCTSTGNIVVHQDIINEFREKFLNTIKLIHVDHPIDFSNTPFMSSLIDQASSNEFEKFCATAKEQGAKDLLEFKKLDLRYQGHYFSPVLQEIEKVDLNSQSFIGEEIFAPYSCLMSYSEIEEAISISNFTEFGLSGSVFTMDSKIYNKCLEEVDVGIFNLNRSTVGASSKLPFGGVKSSGNFRPAAVSMIDACVQKLASLETFENTSLIKNLKGMRDL